VNVADVIEFYLSSNISFFPLFPSTKIPIFQHAPYYQRMPDVNEIDEWKRTYLNPGFWHLVWQGESELKKRWLEALESEFKKIGRKLEDYKYEGEINIAVCGGFNDLVLIDIEDASKISADPEKLLMQYGLVVKTGKPSGYHLWVRCKDWKRNVKGKNGEIRCVNQYVVAPPSKHPNGSQYCFVGGKIEEVTSAWIKDTVLHWIEAENNNKDEKIDIWSVIKNKAMEIPVIEGKRSDWVFSLTYVLKALGKTAEEAFKEISQIPVVASKLKEKKDAFEWWKKYEWDPIDTPSVSSIFHILKWAEKTTGIGDIMSAVEDWWKKTKVKGYGHLLTEPEITIEIMKVFDNCIDVDGKIKKDYIHIIATSLDYMFYFKALYEIDTLYIYQNGVYVPCEHYFAKILQKVWDNHQIRQLKTLTTTIFKEIITQLKRRNYIVYEDINKNKKYINFKNGLLNIETFQLEPHDPEKVFLSQVPHNYNREAKSEIFMKFITDVFPIEYHDVLQEFIGYCLLPDCRFEKALAIIGREGTGKSTFLEAIRYALGMENVSNYSIQQIENERFVRSELIGKFVNIYNDLPYETLQDSSLFKQIVSGDTINVERKFKQPFSAKLPVKLIFAANQLPKPRDWSGAFFRRWIIIETNGSIEKPDTDFKSKLQTEEVAEAILAWAVEGLKRLLSNKTFSYNYTTEEIAEKYESVADSVVRFINECIEEDQSGMISKDELYERYMQWCKENGVVVVGKIEFGRKIKTKLKVSEKRTRTERYWVGIRFKVAEEENKDEHSKDGEGESSINFSLDSLLGAD